MGPAGWDTAQLIGHQLAKAQDQPAALQRHRWPHHRKTGLLQGLADPVQPRADGHPQQGIQGPDLRQPVHRPEQKTHHQHRPNADQGVEDAGSHIGPVHLGVALDQKQHRAHQHPQRAAGLPAQPSQQGHHQHQAHREPDPAIEHHVDQAADHPAGDRAEHPGPGGGEHAGVGLVHAHHHGHQGVPGELHVLSVHGQGAGQGRRQSVLQCGPQDRRGEHGPRGPDGIQGAERDPLAGWAMGELAGAPAAGDRGRSDPMPWGRSSRGCSGAAGSRGTGSSSRSRRA